MRSPIRRLQYTLMEAAEILDELPDSPSDSDLDSDNTTRLFDEIREKLQSRKLIRQVNEVRRRGRQRVRRGSNVVRSSASRSPLPDKVLHPVNSVILCAC